MRVAVVHNADPTGVINVFGQQNRERYNPKTVERVAKALESGGHTVSVIDGNMHLVEQLRDFMPRVMAHERPGMVFNMAYGIQGVSRYTHLPAMLEMLGVPYVGSGPQAHALALDKVIAKILFDSNGLPTPGFWNFARADEHFDDLVFPVIVKPKMEAVSYGIRVVEDWEALREAVAQIIDDFGQHVLVEQFIAGRELAVGLLGNGSPEVLPIVEIDLGGDPDAIQTADDKLAAPRAKICPAPLSDDERETVERLTRRAFESLGLYDFARVDLRLDDQMRPYILEINSMASLGPTGSYVHAARTAGYTYESLINTMLDVAAVRYFGEEYLDDRRPPGSRTEARSARLSSRVRSHVRSNVTALESMLQHIVDMRTPSDDSEQVNALGDWVTHQMIQLGFQPTVLPSLEFGNSLLFRNHDAARNDVLLLGHLDSAAGHPFRRYQPDGRYLYGTGIAEHKGGLVAMIAALRALRYSRALKRIRCGVLLTASDTVAGTHSGEAVSSAAATSGCVLGLKAADADGAVVVSRSGRITLRVRAAFTEGGEADNENAAGQFCRLIAAAQGHSDVRRGVRIGITDIRVSGPFGEAPSEAEASLSVRFNDVEVASAVESEVRGSLAETPEGMRMRVRGGVRRPPMIASDANRRLFDEVAGLASQISVPLRAEHRWHTADICFVPDSVPSLDGMGPMGTGERTEAERILRSSLVERAALLALAIDHQGRKTP